MSYHVYRESDTESLGLIGDTTQPELGIVPANTHDTSKKARRLSDFRGNSYPSTICYYEQRGVFSSTCEEPSTIWLSKTVD